MFKLSNFRFLLLIILSHFIFLGCQTAMSVSPGIQSEFKAINPSRILAVPAFALPDPAAFSSIDVAELETGNTRLSLESSITSAFQNQPGVSGVSFSTIRKAMGKSPNIWNQLDSQMRSTALKLTSQNSQDRAELSNECLRRQNFLDFYTFCLSQDKNWILRVNALAAKVLNADSALLTAVTSLEKNVEKNQYSIHIGVAMVLIDTNTGKLMWGRQTEGSLHNPPGTLKYPEWNKLFDVVLSDSFWTEFPGKKISKNSDSK